MKPFFSLLILQLLIWPVWGQDAYHTDLQSELQSTYNLPAGNWVFFDNESDILNGASHYGNTTQIQAVSGQAFSQKANIFVAQAGANAFSSGWTIRNQQAVQAGDVMLATFYLRSIGSPGKVNFFVENAATFVKEAFFTIPVDTQWRRYLVPFVSQNGYAANGLSCGYHVGFQAQTIEVGGFTMLNYANATTLEQLPNQVNNEFYEGWEPNATWRAEAAQRIDQYRKVDLTITAENTLGEPVDSAGIEVRMLQHHFAFGSAITASRIAGNNAQNFIYEDKLTNLDGQGHGFNWVVFENDLKWPAWEDAWFVNRTELVNAVSWLRERDISIRGHTLLWPGNSNMPADIASNLNDLPYVTNRINDHIEEILTWPGIEGEIEEWDVLNEVMTNTDIETAFQGTPGYPTGREFFAEVFENVRESDSTTGMWINDFITLSLQQEAGSPQYEGWKSKIQELVDAGVELEGIGFQSHIGGFPNGIPSVLNTLDDFHTTFGLKAKITEFDLPSFVDESLGATYLRDYLTASFSHPSVDGFLFWNFWDGATWLNSGTNLYRLDWTPTMSRDTFVNLVFDQWWTQESLVSNASGQAQVRAFKGTYEISYRCNGQLVRDTVEVTEDMSWNIVCDDLAASREEPLADIVLFPNPTTGYLELQRDQADPIRLQLLDVRGRMVWKSQEVGTNIRLDLSMYPKGMYYLHLQRATGQAVRKISLR
ncbi:MAG: endo-1,4-beta-xylanase [Bacteroidota bacterium]